MKLSRSHELSCKFDKLIWIDLIYCHLDNFLKIKSLNSSSQSHYIWSTQTHTHTHIYIYIYIFFFLTLKHINNVNIFMLKKQFTRLATHVSRSTMIISISLKSFFFFFLRGVSGPAYAHHDYSPRPTGHPASPGAGKAQRGWQTCT